MARGVGVIRHWASCRAIAEFLGVDKGQVHNVWAKLKEENLIEPLLACAEEPKERARKIISEAPAPVQRQLKLRDPDDDNEGSSLDTLSAKNLNLAFWYIKKIGDIDTAERLMRVAVKAIRELNG